MASVLLVDSNASAASDLIELLAEDGHEIDHVLHGEIGLQKLATRGYQLIIVARTTTSGMSGSAFVAALRQYSAYLFTPVIMIGGARGNEDVNAVFGARFSEDALSATVSRLLRPAGGRPSAAQPH